MYECKIFHYTTTTTEPLLFEPQRERSICSMICGRKKKETGRDVHLLLSPSLSRRTIIRHFDLATRNSTTMRTTISPKSIFHTKYTESQQNFTIPVQGAPFAIECIVKKSRNSPFSMFSARISARHQKSTYTPFACTEAKETDVAKIAQMLALTSGAWRKLGSAT